MISLEGKEYLIPLVPIEIPSLTPMVLKISGVNASFCTESLISFDKSFKCMLHGFPSYPVLAIPMKGWSNSFLVRPIACSIA